MASPLIAFRMPADLGARFKAQCAALGVTPSSAMIAAVTMWLDAEPRREREKAKGRRGAAIAEGGHVVQIGPTEPKPGSRLKVKK